MLFGIYLIIGGAFVIYSYANFKQATYANFE